ncbi:MAG: PEP-CTERM sorting domain-containing protein [Fimbriimonadaceae bacterium]|nr:PEP-CTERM sorting domain-containing protein [Fimbriimonadaceae bacterium]
MKRLALSLIFGLGSVVAAFAQLSYAGGTYTQGFDSLSPTGTANTWTDNTTLLGWFSSRVAYNAGDGSSNTGALYSFGASTTDNERALGSIASGTTTTIFFGASFTNNMDAAANEFTIQYTGEQWRNGGNTTQQKLTFEYSLDATSLSTGTWIAASSLDFTGPIATATASALNGNLAANQANLNSLVSPQSSWAQGSNLWIRWTDLNDAGNDHGLAVDNFAFSSRPVPEPASLAALGLGAIALIRRRRK